jgi:hypothetical protein
MVATQQTTRRHIPEVDTLHNLDPLTILLETLNFDVPTAMAKVARKTKGYVQAPNF